MKQYSHLKKLPYCFSVIESQGRGFDCPDDSGTTGPHSDPDQPSCNTKYWQCIAGAPFYFTCPPGLYFDSELLICNQGGNCNEEQGF